MPLIQHPLAGPAVRLAHGDDEAIVALMGAHVVAWRHRGRDMLWLTSTPIDGKPLRGGIPVCWPWFAAHPTDTSQPFHGVARIRPWRVTAQDTSRVTLALVDAPLAATIDIALDDALRVSLTTQNNGPDRVDITAALHTYFAVDDIAAVRVTGLDGTGYIDKVGGGARKVQRGDLVFDREIDRIYTAGRATLHESPRAIEIEGDGTSQSLVAWNAGSARSASVPDLGPGAYRHYVCLETAWAGDDARTLPPHASATLTTVLRPVVSPR